MQLNVQDRDLEVSDSLVELARVHSKLECSGSLAELAKQYKENDSKLKEYFWDELTGVLLEFRRAAPLVDVVLLLALLRNALCVDPLASPQSLLSAAIAEMMATNSPE